MASWAFLEFGCAGAVRDGAGMGIFVGRNAMPWGWPALFRPDEIVDRLPGSAGKAAPLFAAAQVTVVRERAAALGAGDPRFDAFRELGERLAGVAGWAVMDAAEISQMGAPRELRREFVRLAAVFQGGGVDFGAWSGILRRDGGDEKRALRVTGLGTIRAATSQLALGTPGGSWERAWQTYLEGGPAAPALRDLTDEAAQLLADLEAAGLVRAVEGETGQRRRTHRALAIELLTVAARYRSAKELGEIVGIGVAMGHLQALRTVGSKPFDRVIGLGDPPRAIAAFDETILQKAMDRLGD